MVQRYVAERRATKDPKPLFLVFHGGSGGGCSDRSQCSYEWVR
eukprot:gene2817-4348_t